MRIARCLTVLLVVVACSCKRSERAGVPAAKPSDQVDLLVLGDTGEDTADARDVARAMAAYADSQKLRPDAVLLTGDNFRISPRGVDDPLWKTFFEDRYDRARLNAPFYVLLGNHDYYDGRDRIELDYAAKNPQSRWKIPARWYRVDLPSQRPQARILMLDSNRESLGDAQWALQTKWLANQLAEPSLPRWTIVCGHHPIYSNGRRDDPTALRDWADLFEKHKVPIYIAGHDHSLQHIQVKASCTDYVISAGGGVPLYSIARTDRGPFARSMFGFVHMRLTPDRAEVRFLDTSGRAVHAFTRESATRN